ncbi:FIP1[V]-like protein [Helianthus annuus]|uniref:FIP1[V]-like protein n=1 Tax=Helianthus annuus TaxID=4232 RepID=UPI000B900C9E|nr:FIP1[V]-like protein [Helianthus annuus]XP_035843283.1 FIP1[V]-like protein [Helianthus annuus]XP_035843284.1 FIP1[V]-like protein [Helianthus annuus]
MNEETWKEYCKQLEHRLEATMQSKIHVYESGRAEQKYDPDLPPELAAAAGHDISSENRNFGKVDVQSDLAKGSVHSPMQLMTKESIYYKTTSNVFCKPIIDEYGDMMMASTICNLEYMQ